MIAPGSRCAMIAAARPIAAAESRGDGSTRIFVAGRGDLPRDRGDVAPPVTTKVRSGGASDANRSIVAWIKVR